MANEVELNEKITVEGVDESVSKLNTLTAAAQRVAGAFGSSMAGAAVVAGRVAGAFQNAQGIAANVLGIAGAWKIVETVHETDRLYQAVARVRDVTGIAAERAHGLFDVFELSGMGMEQAESIITRMTAKMQSGMSAVGASGQKVNAILQRMGITAKSGPEERLFAMAKAAEAGKVGINDLVSAFSIPRSQASAMLGMLKQGPEKLKSIQDDTLKSANVIDARAIESHKRMLQIRRELNAAWSGIVGTLYKSLLPAVTEILKEIKTQFDAIAPVAAAIGSVLAANMKIVVGLAKTYLALLIAAKLANMATGTQMGVVGRGRQLFGMANGAMAGRAAAVGGMDYFAARAAFPGTAMFATAGGPIIRILGTVAGRLGIIGVVISVLVVAFELLRRNVLGLRDLFGNSFRRTWESIKRVVVAVIGVLEVLWKAIKPIVTLIAGALLLHLLYLTYVIELVAKVLAFLADVMVTFVNTILWLLNQIPGVSIDYIDLDAKKEVEEAKRGTGETPQGVYQDFRGSKFEITNNFPPGIDGGRVAVAFGDELAALGERRLDAGVRPLFSYR